MRMHYKQAGFRNHASLSADCLTPHQRTVWLLLSPFERLKRVLVMRLQLKNIRAIHDKKLFPQP